MIKIWIFLETAANLCKWFWINFMSLSVTVTPYYLWFQILYCYPTKHHDQAAFVLRGFPFTLKQQKNIFFSWLALSVTCTSTGRLSGDYWHEDDGMLEPGILRSTVAAYFSFHRDTALNLRQHYHMSFTACVCLSVHHQRAISKWCGVYTRFIHLCNRFQTACAISWSIPGLCAISANAGHIYLRGSHHLTLPTLCVGLHPVLQENHHRTQINWCRCHRKWRISQVLISPIHCWMSFLPGRKCWTCMGWDGLLISSWASAAFRSQQICNGLIKISCMCGLSSCLALTHVSLVSWGEYAQQWLMHT